ncbi:hypothetical protein HK101_003332, partial [Irineochytrium annulatum]
LGMKADEWSKEQATEELKKWYEYRINKNKFSWSEVERAIGQAFDKDYKGPSPDYEFEKDLMMSQAKLAEVLKVNLRSLQYVLKNMKDSGMLVTDTKRIGRSNVSRYFLDEALLKDVTEKNDET